MREEPAMNEIISALFARKSIRAFRDETLSESEKQLIIRSAIQAPTAGNQVLYTILEIDDQAVKDRLAVLCDNQPFIARAPYVLVFLADCRKWLDAYRCAGIEARRPGLGDIVLAIEDAMIAAQNAVMAAQSLGIGSCYIGDILENREETAELLGLDEYVMPATLLVFGYPTEPQTKREKPKRFDEKHIVRKNRYSRMGETELRSMFGEVHAEDGYSFEAYLQAFCARKYMSDFAREMDRSVGKYLEAFGDDPGQAPVRPDGPGTAVPDVSGPASRRTKEEDGETGGGASWRIVEGMIDPVDFNRLRKAVGWEERAIDDIELAFRNTRYMVHALNGRNEVIGTARIIGDEGLIYYVQDVMVLPEYQNQGIGKRLMDRIMGYLEEHKRNRLRIGLMAAKGKEGFYGKYGFVERPNETQGPGMLKKY
jgi:nitroreductase/GNAT superfamily N-acetyltransferase